MSIFRYTSGRSPKSLEMAAHSGAAPLFTNYHAWDVVMAGLETFNQIRAGHGWPSSPAAIATTVYVDHDDQRARDIGEQYWRKTSGMTVWHYDRLASPYFMPGANPAERETAVVEASMRLFAAEDPQNRCSRR